MSTKAIRLHPAQHLELVAGEVARLAAQRVRAAHGTATQAGTKSSPTDVVTRTDVETEELIRAELMARAPGSAIVGEELTDLAGSNHVGWIVDPIDGTVNFLYGLPVVSVSIAATIDGTVVAGAVTDVLRGDTFSASIGGGARRATAARGSEAREAEARESEARESEALAVSSPESLGLSLIGTGFAYDAGIRQEQAQALTRLLPECRDIRCMGSAALNLCWVAAGLLDGYFERDIKLYDFAAGALIATEAGASVEVPTDNDLGMAVAASPGIAAALRALVT